MPCENADCPVCEEHKLVSWSYRTGEVTQRVIPAAKDGADFQHGDNDETVKSRGDGVGTPESGKSL